MSPAARAGIALTLMIGFYLLALGIGGGLLALAWFGFTLKSAGGAKLMMGAGLAGLVVLASLRPRREPFEPPGPAITNATEPALFEVLDDVARATKQELPHEVFVAGDVNAAVLNRGGVLGLGGDRVMILGLPLLHALTVDQFKAVLAHEFGHYGGGDTRIGRVVYHTRASLGRTLAAVEGQWLEMFFERYGKMVMRISMAVSRHQEFEADLFAARATSRGDMIDSLRTIDRVARHFSLYLGVHVLPVFEAGYRPRIGRGFTAYCALLASVPHRPLGDSRVDPAERLYDSHPPTSARVAALEALPPDAPRVADRRLVADLLRDADRFERELYQFTPGSGHNLNAIEWADVTERVMVPRWRATVASERKVLQGVRLEALPSSPAEVAKAGKIDLRSKMMDEPEVVGRTLHSIAAGVMLRFIDAGWRPAPNGDRVGDLVRDGETIQPMRRVYDIAFGETSPAEWTAFCQRTGMTGPLVEP